MQPVATLSLKTLREFGWDLWDPIGVKDTGCPRDEYDDYLLGLVSRLRGSASNAEAADYLVDAETRIIGMSPRSNTRSRAESLVKAVKGYLTELPAGSLEPVQIYVFRTKSIARSETVANVAPLDVVISVFGGGGVKGAAGLEAVFGGSVYFQNEETGAEYLGVWGSRNGGHFRSRLRRAGISIMVVKERPPAFLKMLCKGKRGERPVRNS